MGRSKRKRPSNTNVEHKPKKVRSDDNDEETTSDSGSDKTRDNKHHHNQLTASTKCDTNIKNRTIKSGEDDESESDDEALLVIHKKRSKNDKMLEVSVSEFSLYDLVVKRFAGRSHHFEQKIQRQDEISFEVERRKRNMGN